ncbi:MAG: hypothetical protein LBL79_00485 [Prevotella sp.]|nr:hypothetical protein [Prevotella sp.]
MNEVQYKLSTPGTSLDFVRFTQCYVKVLAAFGAFAVRINHLCLVHVSSFVLVLLCHSVREHISMMPSVVDNSLSFF